MSIGEGVRNDRQLVTRRGNDAIGHFESFDYKKCAPVSYGMDAPTLNGINVPKEMLVTTSRNGSVHDED